MAHVRSQDSFDPTQWWLASVDGKPAGVSLGNEHLAENGWGYVGTLGVVKEFRGRGIARLLLETAFAEAHARGRVGVKLGVDSENSTGAPALYGAVGMVPAPGDRLLGPPHRLQGDDGRGLAGRQHPQRGHRRVVGAVHVDARGDSALAATRRSRASPTSPGASTGMPGGYGVTSSAHTRPTALAERHALLRCEVRVSR